MSRNFNKVTLPVTTGEGHSDSVSRRTSQRQPKLAWLYWTLWIIASFALANLVVVPFIWALPDEVTHRLSTPFGTAIVTTIVNALVLFFTIGPPYLIKKIKTTRKEIGLTGWPTWADIFLGVAGMIPYILLSAGLLWGFQRLLPGANWEQDQYIGGFSFLRSGADFFIAFLALVVVVPILEEAIFRGVLYSKLKSGLPTVAAVIISSLLFAIAHGQLNVAVATFALALVACGLREITGTIYAPILLHAVKNGLAFYLLFFTF
ncbi:CPBP family intramembrane metalloprotease [Candidatus Saccharibacteria bacterium]|nr:CPBP family intramembrane metalloprotease [Candidatus Saccharibacteria bacterium]